VTGAVLKGPTIVKYELCRVSKAHKVISRRPLTKSTIPFYRIHLNLIPGIVIYNSNKHMAHFLNNTTWINKVEIIAKKSSLPQVIIKYCNVIKWWHSFKVAIIYTDRETALKYNFKKYITELRISLKISPPYT
jgi:hypothetical protein